MRASFLELYNEEIRDLLSKENYAKKLELRENPDSGVYVKDLSAFMISGIKELEGKFYTFFLKNILHICNFFSRVANSKILIYFFIFEIMSI